MKTPLFQRVMSRIANHCMPADVLVDTNGGIANDLRLFWPSTKQVLLYGKPSHHISERATVALAKVLAVHSEVFADVGANEGLFTFSIAAALGPDRHASIHAFEPDPDLYARLAANLSRNNINARANRIAVGDRVGTQTFYRNLNDDSSGSLTTYFVGRHETAAIETVVTTLADYLAENQLSHACVKVDVEGAGQAVWTGTKAGRDRIDWLIYEILAPEVEAELPKWIMADTGWNAYYIRDFDLVRSVGGEFEYREPFYNWLFCAAQYEELAAVLKGSRFRLIDRPQRAVH